VSGSSLAHGFELFWVDFLGRALLRESKGDGSWLIAHVVTFWSIIDSQLPQCQQS
jgi:hypothetical protein